ncbi:MAG: hypothetical protein ACXAC5_07760 [Promethearchaeota archaeon]|jgi:hypothetical protein
MSSKSTEKKFVKIEEIEEDIINIKLIVIPFSLVFPKKEHFIYDGSEKIPFQKRDSLYQSILLREFRDTVRDKP